MRVHYSNSNFFIFGKLNFCVFYFYPCRNSQDQYAPTYRPTPQTTSPMGKCYCDYCDVFLTHDSVAVRKQHNDGNRHKQNVCEYYRQFIGMKTQRLIDDIVASFEVKVIQGLVRPTFGFPSLNGVAASAAAPAPDDAPPAAADPPRTPTSPPAPRQPATTPPLVPAPPSEPAARSADVASPPRNGTPAAS